MKRLIFALAILIFATSFAPLPARELFNGKNLDGWYKFVRNRGVNNDPDGVFTVVDGAIRVSGQDFGCVTTDEEFENYRLTVEFRWGEQTWGGRKTKARDSGVLIHSFGPDGAFGGVWMRSVEANIVEGGIGDFWLVGHAKDGVAGTCKVSKNGSAKGGLRFDPVNGQPETLTANSQGCFQWVNRDPNWRDELGFRGANDIDRPNDWNELVVVASGDKMTVYLNGTLVNEITGLRQTRGKIQLQSEGAEIFFRRVAIEKL